jgi:small subunit ribosomal protein S8
VSRVVRVKVDDPISDLLTRLRNAMRAGHEKVDVPASRLKQDLLRVLAAEGYVGSFRAVEEKGEPMLRVQLKYDPEGDPIVAGLERVSKPGRRVYARSREIPEVLGGLGISILSTSRGIVTGREARESRLGGEILCNVW